MVVAKFEYSLPQYLEVGQGLVEEGKFVEAIELYEAALTTYPDSASIYQALGFAQEKADQISAGIISYRQAIDIDPHSPIWVYIALGRMLGQQDQWHEALMVHQQSIGQHPDQGDLYRELGLAQDRLGNPAEAILNYQQAVKLRADQPLWVYTTLGVLLGRQQDWQTLVQVYRQAVEQYPEQAELYRELGFAQEQIGDVTGEIESYRQAIDLDVQPVWVYTTLIDLLNRLEAVDRAIEVCHKGLTAYPDAAKLLQRLDSLQQPQPVKTVEKRSLDWYWQQAKTLCEQEEYQAAIEVYQEAIEQYPDRAELYRELGVLQEKVGAFDKEILSYQRAIELEPSEQPAWLYSTLATLLANQGQFVQSMAVFERSLELYPENVASLRQFVKVLIANKEYSRAEEICELITTLKQNDPWVFKELAEIQHKQNKLEEALDNIQTAIQLLPGNCWLTWELASILVDQGNEQDALIEFQHVISNQDSPNWLRTQCFKAWAELKQDPLQSSLLYYQAFHLDRNDSALKDKSLELLNAVISDIAEFYFRYHMWRDAEVMYSFLYRLNPENHEMSYRLGNVLEQLEQREEAIEIYKQCADLAPENITYMEKLGDLMSSYGECYSFRELCFP